MSLDADRATGATQHGRLVQVQVDHRPGSQDGEVGAPEGVEQVGGEGHRPVQGRSREVRLELLGLGVPGVPGVPGVVGVLEQQCQQRGRAGEPAEGDREHLVAVGLRVTRREYLGHPRHRGLDPDRVAGHHPRDHGPQPGLVRAAEPDETTPPLRLHPFCVQAGSSADDRGLGHLEHTARGLAADGPGQCGVDEVHAVGGQVARLLGDAPSDPHLGLARHAARPGGRQTVLEVEHVRDRVRRRHHPGAPRQRDLAEAEVLNRGRTLAAETHQHVADPLRPDAVRPGNRIVGMDRCPLRQHAEVAHLRQPPLPHRCRGGGQQGLRVQPVRSRSMSKPYESPPTLFEDTILA